MDAPPHLLLQLPDARLTVTALALAAAAGFVTLSLFHQATEAGCSRRAGRLVLAAACGATGLWAAHFVVQLDHKSDIFAATELPLLVASLLCIALVMFAGLSLAARPGRWHVPVGGAINGTGMGLMHYLGVAAIALPGPLEWDLPLVLASAGIGVGLNAAALSVSDRFKGSAGLWGGALLVGVAFISLHTTSEHAVHHAIEAVAADAIIPPRHWAMAAVIVGAASAVLVLGYVSTRIDRLSKHDNAELMQQLVDAAIEGIVVVKDGAIVRANRGIAELSGFSQRALIGKEIVGGLLDRPVEIGDVREAELSSATGIGVPVKVMHQRLASGAEVYAVHDLTERRAGEAELRRRNEELREREEELQSRNVMLDTALRHMSHGLCMYDKGERVVMCNEHYATIYGLPPDAVKPGMTRREVIEMRIARGVWAGPSAESYLCQRTKPVTDFGHLVQEMSDGRTISMVHVPLPSGGWVCTHEDITERRLAEERIEHLARHDGLTDLPNRLLLRDRLQEALARLRPGDGLAVHCLDLDRFKEVNDALGHAVGDELLQSFAGRLRHVVGEKDTIARLGGDKFVVVQARAPTARDAVDLAAKIIAAMDEPFALADQVQVVLGSSIGIAMAPGDGIEADLLLKNASLALSRAKQEERGRYRFFEQEMDARVRARHKMERELRSALANGELELYYQPLLNVKRNEISCFEALMRWHTPDGNAIEPGEFIPLAEETGIILPLGEWALRQALSEAAKWPKQIRVAVNLSAVQFSSRNLSQVVMGALAASGVEASRLELEITESLLLQDRETTLATLHQLRDLGVRIALDDFGTGFSSLNYLRSFPFDKLKIDRCFIAGLADGNEESLAIVRAVARLGRSLGIATTAEGIESSQQMEIARKEGFTEIQGFWLGVPMSAAVIAKEYDLHKSTRKPRRRVWAEADRRTNGTGMEGGHAAAGMAGEASTATAAGAAETPGIAGPARQKRSRRTKGISSA